MALSTGWREVRKAQARKAPSYAGREITIIASAQAEGSAFTRIMRGTKTYTLSRDPREYGIRVGSFLDSPDNGLLAGKVVAIRDNADPDDWFSYASEWYVEVQRPWNQTALATSLGECKIEWLEDQLFPRVGTILATPSDSYFRLGDIVRVS